MKIDGISSLRMAVPYLKLYRGQIFVVKVGGECLANDADSRNLLEQCGVLQSLGIDVVLVHGGGPQATQLAERLGAQHTFHEGRRITDGPMLEAMALTLNGQLQTRLLAIAQSLGIKAVGLCGASAGLVQCHKRPTLPLDFGFVGDVDEVDATVVQLNLSNGYLPIISPISADSSGQELNINADVVASHLAQALGASKLIFVTSVAGIMKDATKANSLISQLTVAQLKELESTGVLSGGMLPKSRSIAQALEGGVERVHVIGYKYTDSLLIEIFTNEGCGTLIVGDRT